MSRRTDLEQHIRESYNIIREYEDIQRISDNPKEIARAKREIEKQWGLIEGYLEEHLNICRSRNRPIPGDIDEIRVRFQSTTPSQSSSINTIEQGKGYYVAATGDLVDQKNPPPDVSPPEGYLYLDASDETGLHSFYRKQDEQTVVLIPEQGSASGPFLIDRFQITARQYADFLNACQEGDVTQLRHIGQKKMAVDMNDRILALDALDQWQTGAPSRIPWRFAAHPWGVTYQNGKWTPVPGCDRLPATFITWRGASLYSLWANGQELENVEDLTIYLPTEEQWLAAALWDPPTMRRRRFPWGNRWDSNRLNNISYWAGRNIRDYEQRDEWWNADPTVYRQIRPLEVDQLQEGVSPSGCFQMLGNVWEWCKDMRLVRGHKQRVTKGGACISPQNECMPRYVSQFNPDSSTEYLGFRCCRPYIE